jgi:hypothetical protein
MDRSRVSDQVSPGAGVEVAADAAAPGPVGASVLDSLVDGTRASRERVVDLLRVLSLVVVVLWHWSLSITHWHGGRLTMPNPVGDVPGLWALTWVLQVMPVFFFVGGYANLAGWTAARRSGGGGDGAFLTTRLSRLGRPLLPWLGCWLVADLALRAAGCRSVLAWGIVVFVPLWFIGVYALVVAAVPLTARLHARYRGRVLVGLAAAIGLADALRLAAGVGAPVTGLAGSALVWLWCHQLGYFWRDGTLIAGGRRLAAAIAGAGLAGLVALTTLGPYPRAMVAVRGAGTSNMFPTSAAIAALAVFQLGLVMLARPWLDRRLARRSTRRAVVAANGLAMPVFCWHMTALVLFLGLYRLAGLTLADRPTARPSPGGWPGPCGSPARPWSWPPSSPPPPT